MVRGIVPHEDASHYGANMQYAARLARAERKGSGRPNTHAEAQSAGQP